MTAVFKHKHKRFVTIHFNAYYKRCHTNTELTDQLILIFLLGKSRTRYFNSVVEEKANQNIHLSEFCNSHGDFKKAFLIYTHMLAPKHLQDYLQADHDSLMRSKEQ